MFGLFKKKQTPSREIGSSKQWGTRSAVAPLLTLYESLSEEITGTYDGIDHNPAELRFFTMAATSLFVQEFGQLHEEEMQSLVGEFYEQSAANLLLYMPRADFSRVHTAATQRFDQYVAPIIGVINADTADALQGANYSLVALMDENLRVERGAFDQSLAGLAIGYVLVRYAVQVKDAVHSVRGAV